MKLQEALITGNQALQTLYAARKNISEICGRQSFHKSGGGLFKTLVNHSRIHQTIHLIEDAKKDLYIFQMNLKEAKQDLELRVETDCFLSFTNFFFDGDVADYLVPREILNTLDQIDDAIWHVEQILDHTKHKMNSQKTFA